MADGYEEVSGGTHNPDDSGSTSGSTETGGGEVTGGQTEGGGSTEVGDSSGGEMDTTGQGGQTQTEQHGTPEIVDGDSGSGTMDSAGVPSPLYYNDDIVDIDLSTGTVHRSFVNHVICEGDARHNRYGARLYRNGTELDLTDAQVTGYFIRPDGSTVVIDGGTLDGGNLALVRLPQSCYAYTGNFTLAIKIHKNQLTGTVRIVDGTVVDTTTGTVVDPGRTIPDIDALLAAMAAAEAAGVSYTGANGVQLTGNKFELTDEALRAIRRITPFNLAPGEHITLATNSPTAGYFFAPYHFGTASVSGIKFGHIVDATTASIIDLVRNGETDPLEITYADSAWTITNNHAEVNVRGICIQNNVPITRS